MAVLGAGGRTGRLLVGAASAAGLAVRAVVRDPTGAPVRPAVPVVGADVRDERSLSAALGGVGVVVSLVGVTRVRDARRVDGLFSDGTRNVRAAMAATGTRRLVLVSSLGVVDSPEDDWFYRNVVRPLLLAPMYADMRVMEREALADDLDVTVVRAPLLTAAPATGRGRLTPDVEPGSPRRMGRADLAQVLLAEVVTPRHVGRVVAATASPGPGPGGPPAAPLRGRDGPGARRR